MEYYKKYMNNLSNNNDSFIIKNKLNEFTCNNKTIINNRAIHNDIVYVKDDEVIGIKERNLSYIVGTLFLNKNTKFGKNGKGHPYYLFAPLNQKYPNFYVASKRKEKTKIYVVIQFSRWNVTDKYPYGSIIEEIGQTDIINNEYKAVLYKNNLQYKRFKVNKFKLKSDIKKDNELQNIKPDYHVFSIDPEGCRDIDDAFHYKETENEYQIGIHITDISEYITLLELPNIKQSSSIYLPNEIKHLLPEIYSEDLCSLIKGRIRKTITVYFHYNKEFKLISTFLTRNIVKIRKNYSYDQVDSLLSYDDQNTNLHKFYRTSVKLSNNKIYDSHSLVEYFMIKANSYVAEKLYMFDKKNAILRIHKGVNMNYNDYDELENYLKRSEIESAEYVCNREISDIQHTTLNLKYYTHFTSPIRRLTDIYVHLQLNRLINNEKLIEIEESLLKTMNKFQKNIRKMNNDISKLEVIYKLDENYETEAYIVDFNERSIKLYIPEFSITHKTYLYSLKVESLYEIELREKDIIIKTNDNKIEYNLYQKVNVRLNSLIQENSLQKKLYVKIL